MFKFWEDLVYFLLVFHVNLELQSMQCNECKSMHLLLHKIIDWVFEQLARTARNHFHSNYFAATKRTCPARTAFVYTVLYCSPICGHPSTAFSRESFFSLLLCWYRLKWENWGRCGSPFLWLPIMIWDPTFRYKRFDKSNHLWFHAVIVFSFNINVNTMKCSMKQ